MIFKLILFTIFISIGYCSRESNSRSKFEPSKEWKVVEKGQHLPAGLHIRHNFQTKITEAKFLDDEKPQSENAIVEVQEDNNEQIKKLIEEGLNKAPENTKHEEVKTKFRSYEELKREFGMLNLTVKSDFEIMADLFKRFRTLNEQKGINNTEEFSAILIDLEYLTHQLDNAQEFMKMNGLKNIIFPALLLPEEILQIEALRLFIASVQHNPKVQIQAYEAKIIPILLKLLESDSVNLKTTSLSALISLMRRFPTAQWEFLQSGGFDKIKDFINLYEDEKLTRKIFIFLLDLFVDNNAYFSENQIRNVHSENVFNFLETRFENDGWCIEIQKALIKKLSSDDHSYIEDLFLLIKESSRVCDSHYSSQEFRRLFKKYLRHYDNLSKIELSESDASNKSVSIDADLYFTYLKDVIRNISDSVISKVQDEL